MEVLLILQHHRFQRALLDFVKAKNAYKSYQINSNDTYNIVLTIESKMTGLERTIEDLLEGRRTINASVSSRVFIILYNFLLTSVFPIRSHSPDVRPSYRHL